MSCIALCCVASHRITLPFDDSIVSTVMRISTFMTPMYTHCLHSFIIVTDPSHPSLLFRILLLSLFFCDEVTLDLTDNPSLTGRMPTEIGMLTSLGMDICVLGMTELCAHFLLLFLTVALLLCHFSIRPMHR